MRLLLYCSQNGEDLYKTDKGFVLTDFGIGTYYKNIKKINGTIPALCNFDIEEINPIFNCDNYEWLTEGCNMDLQDIRNYLNDKKGYAIHVKNISNFLDQIHITDIKCWDEKQGAYVCMSKGPQKMMRCFIGDEEFAIIPVDPKVLFNILNGDRTIILKRKIMADITPIQKEHVELKINFEKDITLALQEVDEVKQFVTPFNKVGIERRLNHIERVLAEALKWKNVKNT